MVPRGRVAVVPNGIDTAKFEERGQRCRVRQTLAIPECARVIGTVGRLNEVKCQSHLIAAFARIAARFVDTHLLLVGDGPMQAELVDMSERLGLSDRVHFVGYQEHPEDYLSAMDLFALTSRSEGMPLSVLEAWAAGLPVIASKVGGLPKLVEEDRTGLLFPPGNIDRLENCFIKLLEGPEFAKALGAAGRDEVRSNYSLRRMTQTYMRHYQELLRDKAARAVVPR